MTTKRKWLYSNWTIGLTCAMIPIIIPVIYDAIKDKPLLTTLRFIASFLGNLFLSIVRFEVMLGWIILAIIILTLIIYIIRKINKSSLPDFIGYTASVLKKWKWSWEWRWSDTQKAWVIYNLIPHCPSCDTTLIRGNSNLYAPEYECPRCGFTVDKQNSEDRDKTEMLILDNVRRQFPQDGVR